MTEKRQTSQGYIIRILQHFATKLWNITNFVMLFQAVMKFLSRLVLSSVSMPQILLLYSKCQGSIFLFADWSKPYHVQAHKTSCSLLALMRGQPVNNSHRLLSKYLLFCLITLSFLLLFNLHYLTFFVNNRCV